MRGDEVVARKREAVDRRSWAPPRAGEEWWADWPILVRVGESGAPPKSRPRICRTVRQTKCTWSRLIESFSAARISPTRRYRGRPKLALHLDGDAGQIAVPHEIRVLGQLGS
jgi:hypothetical protein